MKAILLVILLITHCFHISAQTVEKSIEILENAILIADSLSLEGILHKDLQWTHSNGWTQSKKEVFRDFRIGKLTYQEIKSEEIKDLDYWNEDVARVSRTNTVKGTYEHFEFEMRLLILEIWVRENSIWQLWSRQATKIEQK